ncbi:serine/threonine-protein kinase [Isoptericola sp. b490]|uniref:serine/threonine-protein kinase n=1 Tax=Actinotalea lenta TaxID=3064654 RepID=UPI00271428EB|nr:serine/threonine-protein kinase [Isoptericola sp. b490]MDO8122486.1 serine/threonine-protein kinase [Isoptericola sp. b490]
MSSRREPSRPPAIPGYEYVRLLGMGGFADVFLYRQQMPRRQVAVKVLLATSLDDGARARFRAEADIMASLSHHPSIVTVYQADVAPDGRPYLVMEYCSRPGLAQRYRAERMSVAEVLRIGIRLASAVESAHRAGVLHRDIKPANVLVTDFGWPALTDFGIAATAGLLGDRMVGMSIPWSPPEMLADEPVADVRSDVYQLAATVYSLLARRSPFEVVGGTNTAADLVARIGRGALPPTGRGDVPESLQHVLARAMAPDPGLRYHSALALGRAWQQLEAELMLPLTPLDLPDDLPPGGTSAPGPDAEVAQTTRLRPVRTVSPEATAQLARAAASGSGSVAEPGAEEHVEVPDSWRQHVAELERAKIEPPPRRRRVGRVVAAGVAGGLVLSAAVVGVLGAFGDRAPRPEPVTSPTGAPAVSRAPVPAPTGLTASVADDTVVFTWANPSPEPGDRYLWGRAEPGRTTAMQLVDTPRVVVHPDAPGQVCIEVAIVRDDGRYTTNPAVGCAP